MRKPIFLLLMGLALMVAVLPWGGNQAFGNAGPAGVTFYANSPSGWRARERHCRKFVDSLPGLSADGGVTGATTWGSIFPLRSRIPTSRIPGCDYYQIGIVKLYAEQGCIRTCPRTHQTPGLC